MMRAAGNAIRLGSFGGEREHVNVEGARRKRHAGQPVQSSPSPEVIRRYLQLPHYPRRSRLARCDIDRY